MQKKYKLLFISYLVILLCTVLIIGGSFSLFSDSKKVSNHLQAGNLKVELYRTYLEYTNINELGYLDIVKDNDFVNFSNNEKNIFGLDSSNLFIIPGSYFLVELLIVDKGTVPFDYQVKLLLNSISNKLVNQLNIEVQNNKETIVNKKLNEVFEYGVLFCKEMDKNKESFTIKITFLDLIDNNDAENKIVDFDLVVEAVQKLSI